MKSERIVIANCLHPTPLLRVNKCFSVLRALITNLTHVGKLGANDVALFMLTKLMTDCPAVRPLIAMALREPLIDSAEFSLKQLQALLEKVWLLLFWFLNIFLLYFLINS